MSIGNHLVRVNIILTKKNWRDARRDAGDRAISASRLIDLILTGYFDEMIPGVKKAVDAWHRKYVKMMEGCAGSIDLDD